MNMNDPKDTQSEEVREFMPYSPRWIIKSGNIVILAIVLGSILLAQFIRYPETVTGAVTITTEVPSVKLVNRISGRIEKLFVKLCPRIHPPLVNIVREVIHIQ